MSEKKYLDLPIFCNGESMKLEIKDILYEGRSEFQKLAVVDTDQFGKCLIINDILQRSDADHDIYDTEMLKPLKKTDTQILLLGGGDGDIVKKATEMSPNVKIDMIDLDIAVINCAKEFLGQTSFDNANLNLSIGDAVEFLKNTEKTYDGIICDLTDDPVGAGEAAEEFKNFYEQIITLSANKLKNGGWMSIQGGATCTAEGFIDEAATIQNLLGESLSKVVRTDVLVPSYGETCAFLFAEKK